MSNGALELPFSEFIMSTKNDATYLGKVYLVRIKETEDYSSDDVVLAIGHVGKDNVDYEDFRNIVTVLNEKGLWTPFLSTERASWSSSRIMLIAKP